MKSHTLGLLNLVLAGIDALMSLHYSAAGDKSMAVYTTVIGIVCFIIGVHQIYKKAE